MAPISIVDSTYKVAMDARPSNYLVTHVSWERPKTNLNWFRYVLVRSPFGYPQNPDDGELIFPNPSTISATGASRTSIGFSDDVILKVSGVNTGGVISALTVVDIGAASGIAMTSVSPVSTDAIKGKNAVVSISSGGTPTVVNGGGNYVEGDVLRIAGNSLTSTTSTTTLPGITASEQLGITNTFHIYDTGATTATTSNPVNSSGYGTEGVNPYGKDYNKYYYSLFAYVAPTNYTGTLSVSDVISANGNVHYTNFNWIKIGETSSSVVYKNKDKSTKDVLLEHLPNFYTGLSTSAYNQDLADFIALLAFHFDTYLAKVKAVYEMSDIDNIDEVLLKEFLKEYGSDLKKISDISQARVVLTNIIRNYSLSGTSLGLKNLIESYTGNPVKQIAPLNILPDYNTSSFVEGVGRWYPNSVSSYSYANFYPYEYTYTAADAALDGFGGPASQPDGMVLQILDESIVSTNGTSFTNNIVTSPFSSFTGKLAYIYSGSGTLTPNYETVATVSASNGKTITVDDTSKIKLGAIPLVISGTGLFAPKTVVTFIDKNGKDFKVNITPTTQPTSGASIAFSNTITSGSLSVRPANVSSTPLSGIKTNGTVASGATTITVSGTITTAAIGYVVTGTANIPQNTYITNVSGQVITLVNPTTGPIPNNTSLTITPAEDVNFYHGIRKGLTATSTAVSTDARYTTQFISAVKPYIYKIGDYVTGHSSIPDGTKVVSLGTSDASGIGISHKLTATLPASTTLYFSSVQSTELGVAVDTIPVDPSTPYTFLIHTNANGKVTKDIGMSLTWYDKDGNVTGAIASAVTPAATAGSPIANTDFAKSWYPAWLTVKSPSNDAYVEPGFTVNNMISNSRYCIDGAMLIRPVNVVALSRVSNVATLTTDVAHNFYYDTTATTSVSVAVTVPSSSGFDTDGSAITNVVQNKTDKYTFSYTSTGASTNISAASGDGTTTTFTVPDSSLVSVGDTVTFANLTGAFANVVSGIVQGKPTGTSFTILSTASGTVTYSGTLPVYTIYRSGLASAIPMVKQQIGSNYYYLTGFQDARNTTMEVIANRANIIRNPSFEYDTVTPTSPFGWTGGSGCTITSTTGTPYIGSRYLSVSKTTTGTALPAKVYSEYTKVSPADLFYTASCYVRNIGGTAPSKVKVGITFKLGDGGTYTTIVYGDSVTLTTAWQRVWFTTLVPDNAQSASIEISSESSSTGALQFGVDAVMLEKSANLATADTYFDGDFDGYNFSLTRDSMWESTPGQSTSHLYTNRVVNQGNMDSLALRSINYA